MKHLGLTIVWLLLGCGSTVAADQPAPVNVPELKGYLAKSMESRTEEEALKALRDSMKKMYGIELAPVLRAEEGRSYITIGREEALASGRITPKELASVGEWGYVVKCGDGQMTIAGRNGWATCCGVYAFLEKAGVRFFGPHASQAYIPKLDTKEIPAFTLIEKPAFVYRNGRSAAWKQVMSLVADPTPRPVPS